MSAPNVIQITYTETSVLVPCNQSSTEPDRCTPLTGAPNRNDHRLFCTPQCRFVPLPADTGTRFFQNLRLMSIPPRRVYESKTVRSSLGWLHPGLRSVHRKRIAELCASNR